MGAKSPLPQGRPAGADSPASLYAEISPEGSDVHKAASPRTS